MRDLVQDVRFGGRLLANNPGFTAVAVLCLALGIGGNSAIFSVFNRIALQPLPYGADESLVTLRTSFSDAKPDRGPASLPELEDLRRRLDAVDAITAFVPIDANLEFSRGEEPAQAVAIVGDAGMFRALGVAPALGRDFRDEESETGNNLVVILSHHIWQREYRGDARVIGRTLLVDSEEHRIVGVMPPGFRFPFAAEAELFAPMAREPGLKYTRGNRFLSVFARVRAGADIDDVQRELDVVAAELCRDHPEAYPEGADFGLVATSARDELFGSIRPAILALMLAVGSVLLIACANVASLLLARGTTRAGELALRAALGARRRRLIRQLLAESLLLGLLGAGGGLLVALWGIDLLVALGPEAMPHLRTVTVDGSVLVFTIGCAVVTGAAFGLVPALQASRPDLTAVLNASTASTVGGGRATETSRSRGMRQVLLGAEIALALLLLIAAGLSLKSLHTAERADLGFRSDRVVTMSLKLPYSRYPGKKSDERLRFYGELFESACRGADAVDLAAVSHLPLSGDDREYAWEAEGSSRAIEVQFRIITPDYFEVMGIPVLAGRAFRGHGVERETGVVVDEVLARRQWGDQNPVGKRVRVMGEKKWQRVIGVVGSVRHAGAGTEAPPHVYLSYTQWPLLRMALVSRVDQPPEEIARRVRAKVHTLDPQLAVYDVKTMNQRVYESLALYRFSTLLLAAFAALALLLALIGVYAVMAYTLAQRRREMALRLVLGARPRQLVAMLVRRGLRTAGIGIGIGLALSPLVGFGLSTWLVKSPWFDPLVAVAAAVGVFMASSIACLVAARHVAEVDPALALRAE